MKITHQLISIYPVFSTASSMKTLPKALLSATIAVTLSLAACTSSTPTPSAETTVDEPSITAETSTTETSAAETSAAEASTPKTSVGTSAEPADKVYVEEGVAIGGTDPVAYFNGDLEKGEFVEGSADYTHEWKGVTWQFANAENRDAFAADPEAYAPQYGGYCAWAAAQNAIAAISPDAWKVVDGKLYLNANQNIQTRWEKDIPGFIAQANENWPALSVQ